MAIGFRKKIAGVFCLLCPVGLLAQHFSSFEDKRYDFVPDTVYKVFHLGVVNSQIRNQFLTPVPVAHIGGQMEFTTYRHRQKNMYWRNYQLNWQQAVGSPFEMVFLSLQANFAFLYDIPVLNTKRHFFKLGFNTDASLYTQAALLNINNILFPSIDLSVGLSWVSRYSFDVLKKPLNVSFLGYFNGFGATFLRPLYTITPFIITNKAPVQAYVNPLYLLNYQKGYLSLNVDYPFIIRKKSRKRSPKMFYLRLGGQYYWLNSFINNNIYKQQTLGLYLGIINKILR